jgi:hypothetical protein
MPIRYELVDLDRRVAVTVRGLFQVTAVQRLDQASRVKY